MTEPLQLAPSESSDGFGAAHAVGGVGAAIVGAVAVAVCNHFGFNLSDPDSLLVGAGVVSVGLGVGHAINKVGIFGLFKRVLHGSPSA